MPELVNQATTRIELREDFWIEVKARLSYGDKIRVRQGFLAVDEQGKLKFRSDGAEDANRLLIEVAVTDWNVTENGQKALINRESIERLDDDDALTVLAALDKLYKGIAVKKNRK